MIDILYNKSDRPISPNFFETLRWLGVKTKESDGINRGWRSPLKEMEGQVNRGLFSQVIDISLCRFKKLPFDGLILSQFKPEIDNNKHTGIVDIGKAFYIPYIPNTPDHNLIGYTVIPQKPEADEPRLVVTGDMNGCALFVTDHEEDLQREGYETLPPLGNRRHYRVWHYPSIDTTMKRENQNRRVANEVVGLFDKFTKDHHLIKAFMPVDYLVDDKYESAAAFNFLYYDSSTETWNCYSQLYSMLLGYSVSSSDWTSFFYGKILEKNIFPF